MSNHPFSKLPPQPLSPPDRSEEHDYPICSACGEIIDPEWKCRCDWIEDKIEDRHDWWNEEWSDS